MTGAAQGAREGRRHPRVGADFPVLVQGQGSARKVRARNLSMTGVLLEAAPGLADRRLLLELDLPEEVEPVRLEGEVVRTGPGLAVRFLDLGWSEILALARYLSPRL